ncbi:hypothetical protein FSW04_20920 [Baekduia soli]|uniref:Uncharacterized protein n=1 Tax=Baekduia soli TaxID=496014 RepID=A0A5B8UAF3_9ACTN|nr:hypothetical protein [Baekduia soli]QEC49788.1 hypothetical protein FSW04_20920 [Baekduia soli]
MTEHRLPGGGVVHAFARIYVDESTAAAAAQRAAEALAEEGDVRMYRFVRPIGQYVLAVLAPTDAELQRTRRTVAWGGEDHPLGEVEVVALRRRFDEAAADRVRTPDGRPMSS